MTYRRPTAPPPPVQAAAGSRDWAGKSSGWRYYAQRIDGTGPATTFLHNELRLQDVTIDRALSGPNQLTATIKPVDLSVQNPVSGSTEPLIMPERGTLIHAEYQGDITDSFLLMGTGMSGPQLSIDASGITTVAKNLNYPTSVEFIEADPLNIIRHMWTIIQSDPDSNIGLIVDPYTVTGLKIGKAVPVADTTASSEGDVSTTTSADDKPYALNWWSTHDLGGEIDKLCAEQGIEYRVRSVWNADKTQVLHYLEFGYPALGTRRNEVRFVVGENIQTMPDLSRDGDNYANHVVVLGAGEGSEMVRGEARVRDGRVRTMVTVDDKSITDQGRAQRVARLELAQRQQLTQVTDIVIRNTGLAPYGSFGPGDEIRVQGMTDWAPFDLWARVTRLVVNPDNPDFMQATIMRTDWYH
jgi:hypothetical protein